VHIAIELLVLTLRLDLSLPSSAESINLCRSTVP
jgi:hypothetical protein